METPGKLKYIWLRNRKKSFSHCHFGSLTLQVNWTDRVVRLDFASFQWEPELVQRAGELVPSLSPTSSTTWNPQPRVVVEATGTLQRELSRGRIWEGCSEHLQAYLAPCSSDFGSDAAILKRRKQPAPDADLLRPRGTERTASPSPVLVGMSLHASQVAWMTVEGFFFQTARKRISVPERTTAKTKLYPAAAAVLARLRPAQTINNARLLQARQGREPEKLLLFATGLRRV